MTTGGALVGRRDSVETLARAVDQVVRGHCAVVEVSGGPGVGRTRLLAEASALATAAGLTVREGRATRLGRDVPLALYTDVLPTETAPDQAAGTLRRQLSPGSALLLDDVHWADPDSLALTEFLIRTPPEAPLLLVVAFRTAQAPVQLVDAVTRAGERATRVRLNPLVPKEVEALFPDAGPDRQALLTRASNGNPLYLHALARLPDHALADLVRRQHDRDAVPLEEPARQVLRALAVDLVALDEPARRVAHAVAVVGEAAGADLVAWIAEQPVAAVADALDQLCGCGLGDMDGAWFRFHHPLIRLAAYDLAGPAWRLRAHARVADHLRAHDAPLPVLAHHVERSAQYGDEQAASTLLDAAESLVYQAPATAARWLGMALRVLPDSSPVLARRSAILLRYARALGLSGALSRSWEVLQEVLWDRHPTAAEAVPFGMVVARLRGDLDRAKTLRPDPGGRPAVEGQFELQRAALAALEENAEGVLTHARRALDLLDGQRPALAAGAHALAAWATLCTGEPARAHTHTEAATTLLDAVGDATLAPHAELFGPLAWVETRLGNLSAASRHLARACAVVELSEHSTALPYLLIVDAALRVRRGRLDDAMHLLDRATLAAEQLGSPEIRAMADAVRLRPLLWTAGPAAVFTAAGRLTALNRPRSRTWWRVARLNLGIAHAAAENVGPCLDLLTDPAVTWPPDPPAEVTRHATLAQAWAVAGDLTAASHAATEAETIARSAKLDYERALAWYAGAFVSARDGRLDHAGTLADAAADRFAACGAGIEEARARHLAGVVAAQAGRAEHSRDAFGRAKAGYAACHATWLLSTITRDQRRSAARSPRRGRLSATNPDTLTSRERQIADLVAAGLTNQQIATKLFLSRRTVESHLSHIFPKLDVRSRTALTRRLGETGSG
jgi:DNA-binding CsgD family transcriptional regulator